MSDRTRTAVAAARARGVHVVIATGRMYRSTLRYARMLDLPGQLGALPGAMSHAADDGARLSSFHRPDAAEAARAAARAVRQHGLAPALNIGDRLLIGRGPDEKADDEGHGGRRAGVRRRPRRASMAGHEWSWRSAPRGCPIGSCATGGRLRGAPGRPSRTRVPAVHGHRVTKSTGLAFVADRLGIPMSAVMAVGDQSNDLQMLRDVGLGVAMGDAPAEVRAVADEGPPGRSRRRGRGHRAPHPGRRCALRIDPRGRRTASSGRVRRARVH